MPSPSPAYTPLLPSSETRAFDQSLFRSSLGSPPPPSKVAPTLPPKYEAIPTGANKGQIYLTLETVFEEGELEEDGQGAEGMRLKGLERGLYGYSCASLLLTALYFASPRPSLSPILPPSPILALAAYIFLLLTFRTGVRRIAMAVDEPRVGGRAGAEMGLLGVQAEDEEDEEDEREGVLEGAKGVAVQGLTLLAAAALIHLPVHALNTLPIGIGFAAWCCSTCLVGLMMYDAVNRAASSAEAEKESDGLTWVGGYITKV